jgi:glycosyltransferase involved in cell wall biosynthesis
VNPSLSVILPVRNAQERLVDRVTTLLDIVSDLTSQFEIAIVDDGSTDHTVEVAQDLAHQYPQVVVQSHGMCQGHKAAVETGLRHTTGEIVLVQDDQTPISSSQLQRLWRMRNDQPFEKMTRAETGASVEAAETASRLVAKARKLHPHDRREAAYHGTAMIRRSAVEQLGSLANPTSHLAAHRSVRADQQEKDGIPSEGPNFLLRLRELVAREIAAHHSTRE